jgi:hypothetical protein
MAKFIYIVFFTLIGLLFIPIGETYACKKEPTKVIKDQKYQSRKVKSATTHTVKHCKKNCSPQGVCVKHGKNCKGNCSDVSCQCSTVGCAVFILPSFSYTIRCKLLVTEKMKFPTTEAFCFDGFLSVWLPPKIS